MTLEQKLKVSEELFVGEDGEVRGTRWQSTR
jgi:hypothetical protein